MRITGWVSVTKWLVLSGIVTYKLPKGIWSRSCFVSGGSGNEFLICILEELP